MPVGEIGEADEGARRDAQQFVDDAVGPLGRLQRLRQYRIVERIVRIVGKVAVGVALNDRLAARDGRGDVGGIDLEPARIDALAAQRRHQLTVAAADVEHARARGHGIGDDREIGTQRHRQNPVPSAPATSRSSAGTSRRKLSWPKGADSSTKLAAAPTLCSAWTTRRDSAVG